MQGCRLELRPKRVEERSTCLKGEDVIFKDIVVAVLARYMILLPRSAAAPRSCAGRYRTGLSPPAQTLAGNRGRKFFAG